MTLSQTLRKRLTVTADDYGIRATVEPILRLARAKKLDRVAVMINYVNTEEAAWLIETGVKIDLHLELIHLMGRGDRSGEGTVTRLFSFFSRLLEGKLNRANVRTEWQGQIEQFRLVFGRLPDGLNSHEHVHYYPPFFGVVTILAQQYNIPFIRFGRRGVLSPTRRSIIGLIIERLARISEESFRESQLSSSEYVVDLNWVKSFDHLIEQFPREGSVELIVHPEASDEASFVMKNFPSTLV